MHSGQSRPRIHVRMSGNLDGSHGMHQDDKRYDDLLTELEPPRSRPLG